MLLTSATATIPGNSIRVVCANPSRPLGVAGAVGTLGAKVIVRENDGRFTVERWITSNGRAVQSCGQTYYGNQARAIKVAAAWIMETATANGGTAADPVVG